MGKIEVVAAIAAFIVFLSGSVRAQDDCVCPVTNKGSVVTASGSCTIPGQGAVKCFQMSLGSVPGSGVPDNGRCVVQEGELFPCGVDVKDCRFEPIRFVVTAASCFATCGGSNGMKPTVTPSSFIGTVPSLSAGGTAIYDVSAGNNVVCGSKEQDVSIQFKNRQGQTLFELRARYHCGQCKRAP